MINSNYKKKKIAYVSGTRADFGLMISVLNKINKSKKLKLKMYATGMHLMPEFGETIKEVKKQFPDVIPIKAVFKTDDRIGIAKFITEFTTKLTSIFIKDRPDLVLVLGDRPEALCIGLVCLYLDIPVGHIHGGDVTLTIDGIARHVITKLSSIHFPATKGAVERIKKMGEESWRVHQVGAPGIDIIKNFKLPDRKELFKKLDIPYFQDKFILFIQHPYYESGNNIEQQITESLEAIKSFRIPVVTVYPNADPGGRKMIKIIDQERKNSLFHIFPNVEHEYFLALEKEAGVMVGNSSSAVIEAGSFKTPVVNIGLREYDREKGANVINTPHKRSEITKAIRKSLYDQHYLADIKKTKNPWGDGKASDRIVKILEDLQIDEKLLIKKISY
jgi:GDP/UDP-N,N'-diacetylbacillosamine 2-epimerase (hydrolysing)